MKLVELVKEESIGDAVARWTPKQMTDAEIIAWCKEKASGYLEHSEPIFRGTSGDLTGLLDTRNLKRTSANTLNTYNLWIDNHASWRGFPKRSQSLICSNSQDGADLFGDVYLIIPADGTKVGVCPESDMWGSFNDIEQILGPRRNADSFLNVLDSVGIESDSWNNLKKSARQTKTSELRGSPRAFPEMVEALKNWAEKNEYDTIYNLLEDVFDPDINGFKLVSSVGLDEPKSREMWMSGDIMQVEIQAMSDELRKFFEENNLL